MSSDLERLIRERKLEAVLFQSISTRMINQATVLSNLDKLIYDLCQKEDINFLELKLNEIKEIKGG